MNQVDVGNGMCPFISILEKQHTIGFKEMFKMRNETHLLHHHILTLANELVLSAHNRLEKLEILYMAPMGLDTVDEMLDDLFAHFATQSRVVFEDTAHCLGISDLQTQV